MRTRIPAILLAGLLAGLLLAPAPAAAHSFLRDAEPKVDAAVARGPRRITLWFNEPVEAQFARIAVLNQKGRRARVQPPAAVAGADALAVRLGRRLPPGRYLVRWRVLSADSHVQSGEFSFRVKRTRKAADAGAGAAAAAPGKQGGDAGEKKTRDSGRAGEAEVMGADAMGTGVQGAAAAPMAPGKAHAAGFVATTRGLTTAGLLLLVGLVVFWMLAWRSPGASLAPPDEVQRRFVRRWQRLATAALTMTVVATVGSVVVQGSAAAGVALGDALRLDIVEGVLATGFGKAAVGRLVLLELLAILAVLWRVPPLFVALRPARAVGAAALEPAVSTTRLLLLGAVIAPLLLTMSMVSHATSASPVALHVAADVVHLAAAGAWIGGLIVLTLAAFPATRELQPAQRVSVLAPSVVRFSRIAAVSVFLVVVTGVFRGLDTVGGWSGLTTTSYGTALLLKLAVFAVLLGLGAVNHLWAVRRIRAAAQSGTHTTALLALRRSVAVESVLAVVIVVVTAVLVSLPMATG